MNLTIDFHNSEIADIKIGTAELEIQFSQAVIHTGHQHESTDMEKGINVPATITIHNPKYKALPKKGKLTDGELYGIPGRALNGRVPVYLHYQNSCELELSTDKSDFTITGSSIKITADLTKLPAYLRQ